jgi:hypothetical protein
MLVNGSAMSTLFTSTSNNADYVSIRCKSRFEPIKSFCEAIWTIYEPFADPDFQEQFGQQPHQRFWEMYLGVQLLSMDCKLQPKSSAEGPDFYFQHDGLNVWVEAVAPGEGEGDDRVPTLDEHSKSPDKRIPDEKIILRFANAISKKHNQFKDYIDKGLVSANDACIIAINGGNIDMVYFNYDYPLPLIMKTVCGYGDYTVRFDTEGNIVDQGYSMRTVLFKKSKATVPTNIFRDPNFSLITGVLYSSASLLAFPPIPGAELLYVHNFVAAIKMPRKWMGKGRDCWKTNNYWNLEVNNSSP